MRIVEPSCQAILGVALKHRASAPDHPFYSLYKIHCTGYICCKVAVAGTDEFVKWYRRIDRADQEAVRHVVDMLEGAGLALGYPHSSAIKGSRHALRELRPKRGASPLRVIYVLDPRREAVLLIGGDKSGDKSFYERIVPKAETIFDQYLEEEAEGLHDRE